MKIVEALPLAVSSSEIDGYSRNENQIQTAIKESDSNVASTNSVGVVVPGVHLTLERGAYFCVPIKGMLPCVTSTENSGQSEDENLKAIAAAQE